MPSLCASVPQPARRRSEGDGNGSQTASPFHQVLQAAGILWLLNDPGVYHRLVIEQHWSPGRYQDLLADALISLLIPASYGPET